MIEGLDYTVYTCKDGRQRVYIKESKKVISYPRFLMEQFLGHELLPEEDVHHIDGNPLNNELDNLQIIMHGEHQRQHMPSKYHDKIAVCVYCGKEFLWTAKQQQVYYRNRYRRQSGPFCSKSCIGKYRREKQLVS